MIIGGDAEGHDGKTAIVGRAGENGMGGAANGGCADGFTCSIIGTITAGTGDIGGDCSGDAKRGGRNLVGCEGEGAGVNEKVTTDGLPSPPPFSPPSPLPSPLPAPLLSPSSIPITASISTTSMATAAVPRGVSAAMAEVFVVPCWYGAGAAVSRGKWDGCTSCVGGRLGEYDGGGPRSRSTSVCTGAGEKSARGGLMCAESAS